jgi:hypothetical protein
MLNSLCGYAILMLVLLEDLLFGFCVFTEIIKQHLIMFAIVMEMLANRVCVFWGQGYDAQWY